MDTVVTVHVVREAAGPQVDTLIERALGWFGEVEAACSRFTADSEVIQLASRVGVAVEVSPLLFELLRFALAVARQTHGVFDPTVGAAMERLGFDRDYRSGQRISSGISESFGPTYRDIRLDPLRRTVTLLEPVIIDLGAVAKGLAIDLAARELKGIAAFAIEAGGDVYVHGAGPQGDGWHVGIRHPRNLEQLVDAFRISNAAVCTSGDYLRKSRSHPGEHHIIDPRTGQSPSQLASATVIAPSAMLADALSTAAFILGPARGLALIERSSAEGVLISPNLDVAITAGLDELRI